MMEEGNCYNASGEALSVRKSAAEIAAIQWSGLERMFVCDSICNAKGSLAKGLPFFKEAGNMAYGQHRCWGGLSWDRGDMIFH